MACGVAALGCRAVSKGGTWSISLLQTSPGFCVCVDGPIKVESVSRSWGVFVDGLVKCEGVSQLTGHMCCMLCRYSFLVLQSCMILVYLQDLLCCLHGISDGQWGLRKGHLVWDRALVRGGHYVFCHGFLFVWPFLATR